MEGDFLYVWSGSLRGVPVDTGDPLEAVDTAVRDNLPCVLSGAIRVSPRARGGHPLDVFYEAPYEELFPDLFNGDLDIRVVTGGTT
jgi:hypothetical protein